MKIQNDIAWTLIAYVVSLSIFALFFVETHSPLGAQTCKIIGFSDLQDWWPMENGSGTSVTDRGPGGHTGTITGATWTTGVLGSCLLFNGTSNFVDFSTGFRPAFNQAWSASCWVFDTSVDGTQRAILTNDVGGAGMGLFVNITTNKPLVFFGTNNSNFKEAIAPNAITANAWHFVVGTWDGSSTLTCYLDSIGHSNDLVTGTITAITYAGDLFLGNHTGSGGNEFWGGKIDDVQTYNHAMTQSEINYRFNCGRQQTEN